MTVLIVDDEPSVLRCLGEIVKANGYEVLLANGGDEALAICEAGDSGIDLMISDVAMPKMNGRELAECMNCEHPGVPVLFISGYPESRAIIEGLTARGFKNGYTYLQKPFLPEELRTAMRFAFKASSSLRPRSNSSAADSKLPPAFA